MNPVPVSVTLSMQLVRPCCEGNDLVACLSAMADSPCACEVRCGLECLGAVNSHASLLLVAFMSMANYLYKCCYLSIQPKVICYGLLKVIC